MKHTISLLALTVATLSFPAFAVDNDAIMARMDRLERDTMVLQRQVARAGSSGSTSVSPELDTSGAAQLQVRLDALEEELRNLRGKVEESEFQARKANESLEKFQKDAEFRFTQLEQQAAAHAAANTAAAPAAPGSTAAASGEPHSEAPAATDNTLPTKGTGETPKDPAKEAAKPQETEAPASFTTPRDHYNYAFRLLNQSKYEEASTSFKDFTKKYPKDPLAGNAYYWLGESYYIRRDYVNSADSFRAGFEASPTGPKAADNLLKLGMSLDAQKRNKEACVVLRQVVLKYAQTAAATAKKAQAEQKRMACQ